MLRRLITQSADQTHEAGIEFAGELDAGAVVALHGDLGSGKTTFVQGVAVGMGVGVDVTSPTFALIHEYGHPTAMVHIDCYREGSIDKWIALGIEEYLSGGAVCLIEWPETIAPLLPGDAIHLHFTHLENDRHRSIWRSE